MWPPGPSGHTGHEAQKIRSGYGHDRFFYLPTEDLAPFSIHIPSSLLHPTSLFPLLPSVHSFRGFAHAAGFAPFRQCLRFLVSYGFNSTFINWIQDFFKKAESWHTVTSGIPQGSMLGRLLFFYVYKLPCRMLWSIWWNISVCWWCSVIQTYS